MSEAVLPGRSPRHTWGPFAYVCGLSACWLALALGLRGVGALTVHTIPTVAVLALLALVSVLTRDLTSDVASSSFTTVILLTAIPLVGPSVAGVMGLLVAFADRRYVLTLAGFFNAVMIGTMTLLGGVAYVASGGLHPVPIGESPTSLLTRLGLPLLAADLVMCLANLAILAGMVWISGGQPKAVVWQSVRALVPLYLGYGIIAFVFVLLWEAAGVGPLSALLIAAPLTIARFVYVQYGDELRAHARIMSMFTTAADSADGRLAAHARRVDELCQLMAGPLGLTEPERKTLGDAAMLHDLGMKGVIRATDTQRGGYGPYTNVRALLPHPELAVQVVGDVDFLGEAAAAIRSHHERMDGRGYPDGLRGEEIPLLARILAVADAFDALTTTRGERTALERDDALAELALSAGPHLDPAVVRALTEALRERPWERHVDILTEGSWLWDHHTLPAMSDVIADELGTERPTEPASASPSEGSAISSAAALPGRAPGPAHERPGRRAASTAWEYRP